MPHRPPLRAPSPPLPHPLPPPPVPLHALLCFCVCQMPYLLTPEAKSHIMHGEAAMEQQQHLSAAAMQVGVGTGAGRATLGGQAGG